MQGRAGVRETRLWCDDERFGDSDFDRSDLPRADDGDTAEREVRFVVE
jgi:hypothetical protein